MPAIIIMFKPTEDRIACQLIPDDSGLIEIVRSEDREDLCRARVLAVGPQCHTVQADHVILVPRWACHETEVDAQPLTLTREAEVLAIVG